VRCARAAVAMLAARTAAPAAAPTPAPRESAAAAQSARMSAVGPSASVCLDTRYPMCGKQMTSIIAGLANNVHLYMNHKVLTYIDYRAVSGVFRTIGPPPSLHPARAPAPKAGGTHSPGGEGMGVNISEDARQWIDLLQYNPSTV
jgi:hypothetical protein